MQKRVSKFKISTISVHNYKEFGRIFLTICGSMQCSGFGYGKIIRIQIRNTSLLCRYRYLPTPLRPLLSKKIRESSAVDPDWIRIQ